MSQKIDFSSLFDVFIAAETPNDARRLFHGRGQRFPEFDDFNIEFLPLAILVVLYKERSNEWQSQLAEALLEHFSDTARTVVIQQRYVSGAPSEVFGEPVAEKFWVEEQGLQYGVRLNQNQNIGFFTDMACVRSWLRGHSAGKKVLNTFAYTCAFSVVAVAGGAASVVNIDLSNQSLKEGRANHSRNQLDISHVHFFAHNIFSSWNKLKKYGPYDIVIFDPPSRQRGKFVADKDYGRALKQLRKLVAPGGELVACLNSPHLGYDFMREVIADRLPDFDIVETISTPFIEHESDPDQGLKVLRCRRVQITQIAQIESDEQSD